MISIFMIVLAFALIRLFTSIWLQIWLDDGDGQVQQRLNESIAMNITLTDEELRGNIADNPDRWFYQLIHGLSLIFMILVGVIKGYSLALALLKGASNLHERMLMSVMRCPMFFFDSTPSGRVLNRFSKDMDESKEFSKYKNIICIAKCNMLTNVFRSGCTNALLYRICGPSCFSMFVTNLCGLSRLPLIHSRRLHHH